MVIKIVFVTGVVVVNAVGFHLFFVLFRFFGFELGCLKGTLSSGFSTRSTSTWSTNGDQDRLCRRCWFLSAVGSPLFFFLFHTRCAHTRPPITRQRWAAGCRARDTRPGHIGLKLISCAFVVSDCEPSAG